MTPFERAIELSAKQRVIIMSTREDLVNELGAARNAAMAAMAAMNAALYALSAFDEETYKTYNEIMTLLED